MLMIGGVAGAQYGAKAGQRLRGEQLRALLAILVLAVALRLGFDLFVRPPLALLADLGGLTMRPTGLIAALTLAALSLLAAPAGAQQPSQNPIPESIQIGLSTNRVEITADFSGADLTIFGSLENADPLISRQGRYDVIVVLEGPAQSVVVRRKDRFLGMWINMESETFVNVPVSYSVATTRPPQDITDPNSYKQLALGANNLHIEPLDKDGNPATVQEFRQALRERKTATGLFSIRVGGVEFLSQSLFRASLPLSPNVPVGTHGARVPVPQRPVHQGKFGAAHHRQVGLRGSHRASFASTTACSTACSPWRWPC